MACLITITGSTGVIQIKYTDGGVENTVYSEGEGSIFVPDTVTAATATTISGDLEATSSCLTLTLAPKQLYKLSWEVANCYTPFNFVAVVADGVETPIGEITFNAINTTPLSDAINELDNDSLKVIATNTEVTGSTWVVSVIAETKGIDDLELKIQGTETTEVLYVRGTTALSVPLGYTDVEYCPITPAT